ncbi:MAG TPA: hypothetical protein VJJ53_02500 [Candidatus Nanoarchaeia archaeon]|nr:hypothetical protein [Candidatus Nanoarchaeia archaeon]
MTKKVVRTGISLDIKLAKKLNEAVVKSPELRLDRSEVINSIIDEYFSNSSSSLEKLKETIIKKRKRLND